MTDPGKKIQLPGDYFFETVQPCFHADRIRAYTEAGLCENPWAYLNTKIIVDKHKHWCYNVGCTIVVAYAYALE